MCKSKSRQMGGRSVMGYYFGENFLFTEIINDEQAKDILDRNAGHIDTRTMSITHGIRSDDWTWYHNYMAFQQFAASKVADARPMYMLDLGYVPVIFLPSCVVELSAGNRNMTTLMYQLLDCSDFEYVTTRPMSFILNKVDIDTMDAWVHKIQAAEVLGCSPENVRSLDIIRRIYG